jgi:hypothetical protein
VNHARATELAVLAFRHAALTRQAELAQSDIIAAEQRICSLRLQQREAEEEARTIFHQMRQLHERVAA